MDFKIDKDLHTHTIYSHGKATIFENVKKAKELDLKYIAITDHGPKHLAAGIYERSLKKMRYEIDEINSKNKDIKTLLGLELNFLSDDGKIDLPKDKELLDIILCGFHKTAMPKKFSNIFSLFLPSLCLPNSFSNTKTKIERNTRMYINAIKNNKIDIISHINRHLKTDLKEVAKVCEDYGVYIEISSRHSDLTHDDLDLLINSTKANFVINSDAHKIDNIKNVEHALSMLKEFSFDKKRIANFEGSDLIIRSKGYKSLLKDM